MGQTRKRGLFTAKAAALRVASLSLLCAALTWPASADSLPQPKGPVLLVIAGDIARNNGSNRASFDFDMLKQIGLTSLVTSTPWTEGQSRFEGVLARDLLNYVGARGDHITAISLNGYLIEIPVSDFIEHDVVFALKRDGKLLGVRDMGPVLVVYPFDRDRSLWTESVFTRCVLQLSTIYVGDQKTMPLTDLTGPDQSPSGTGGQIKDANHNDPDIVNQAGNGVTQNGSGPSIGTGGNGTTHDALHSSGPGGG